MKDILLQPGDVCCSDSASTFGKLIVRAEMIWDKDGDAEYSHSYLIADVHGKTIEALSTVRSGNIDDYDGHKVLIGRWDWMTTDAFNNGLAAIKWEMGKIYPAWRIPLFIVPFFAKLNTWGLCVCSELVDKFLMGASSYLASKGINQGEQLMKNIGTWKGQNPDDVADMIRKWKDFTIIYEGPWKKG